MQCVLPRPALCREHLDVQIFERGTAALVEVFKNPHEVYHVWLHFLPRFAFRRPPRWHDDARSGCC